MRITSYYLTCEKGSYFSSRAKQKKRVHIPSVEVTITSVPRRSQVALSRGEKSARVNKADTYRPAPSDPHDLGAHTLMFHGTAESSVRNPTLRFLRSAYRAQSKATSKLASQRVPS